MTELFPTTPVEVHATVFLVVFFSALFSLYYFAKATKEWWKSFPKVELKQDTSTNRIPLLKLREESIRLGVDWWESEGSIKLTRALQQAGLDGNLNFWGRPNRHLFDVLNTHEPLMPLKPNYWQDYLVDPWSLATAKDNMEVRTYKLSERKTSFLDIHVESQALEWLKFRAGELKAIERKPLNFKCEFVDLERLCRLIEDMREDALGYSRHTDEMYVRIEEFKALSGIFLGGEFEQDYRGFQKGVEWLVGNKLLQANGKERYVELIEPAKNAISTHYPALKEALAHDYAQRCHKRQ